MKDAVFYKVLAFDAEGEFECLRRFSDFEELRSAWSRRLPGIYKPFLPAKKIIGNTDAGHLEERAFLLEWFLRKVYKLPYLLASEEYSVFARHESKADISVKKALQNLPDQSVNMLSFRVK